MYIQRTKIDKLRSPLPDLRKRHLLVRVPLRLEKLEDRILGLRALGETETGEFRLELFLDVLGADVHFLAKVWSSSQSVL